MFQPLSPLTVMNGFILVGVNGHLLAITVINGIIHSINGVISTYNL